MPRTLATDSSSAGPSTGALIRQRGGFPGASAATRVYVPSARATVSRFTRPGITASDRPIAIAQRTLRQDAEDRIGQGQDRPVAGQSGEHRLLQHVVAADAQVQAGLALRLARGAGRGARTRRALPGPDGHDRGVEAGLVHLLLVEEYARLQLGEPEDQGLNGLRIRLARRRLDEVPAARRPGQLEDAPEGLHPDEVDRGRLDVGDPLAAQGVGREPISLRLFASIQTTSS